MLISPLQGGTAHPAPPFCLTLSKGVQLPQAATPAKGPHTAEISTTPQNDLHATKGAIAPPSGASKPEGHNTACPPLDANKSDNTAEVPHVARRGARTQNRVPTPMAR